MSHNNEENLAFYFGTNTIVRSPLQSYYLKENIMPINYGQNRIKDYVS